LFELLVDVLVDGVKDTLVLVPFLYVTYVLMEAIEHGAAGVAERWVVKAGKAGPVVGAIAGVVPQCGFSAMAATLYAARIVTMGTLVACLLSTSDEMLPVFIANRAPASTIFSILAVKVAVGMAAGLLVDLAVRVWHVGDSDGHIHVREICEREHCGCEETCPACGSELGAEALAEEQYETDGHACDHDHGHGHDHGATCGHGHTHRSIWMSALVHTAQVTLFIFIVTVVLDFVIESVGTDVVATYLTGDPLVAIVLSALVGLIPNCASSVLISELYLEGALGPGAMIAGLLVAAGVGILVLLRTNKNVRQNVAVLAILVCVGIVAGLAVQASGFVF
jgi:hypothetical protein